MRYHDILMVGEDYQGNFHPFKCHQIEDNPKTFSYLDRLAEYSECSLPL